RIQGDTLSRAAIDRKFLLKLRHLGTKDKLATFQHAGNRSIDFGFNTMILRFEVEIRYFEVCHGLTEFYCIRDCGSTPSPRRKVSGNSTGRPRRAIACEAKRIISPAKSGTTAGFRFRCVLNAVEMIDLTTRRLVPINLRRHHVVGTWTES